MKASELRVGNFVWEEYGGLYEVININSEGFDYVDLRNPTFRAIGRYDMDSIKPIPLTEEWLLKFGFEYHHDTPHPNRVFRKNWTEGFFELEEIINYYSHGVELKHVHQLQNLYFALTGEELILKEKP